MQVGVPRGAESIACGVAGILAAKIVQVVLQELFQQVVELGAVVERNVERNWCEFLSNDLLLGEFFNNDLLGSFCRLVQRIFVERAVEKGVGHC